MDTAQDPPTPQPVLTAAVLQAWTIRLLGAVALLDAYYGWWTPSGEAIAIIGGVVAVLYSSVVEAVGWFVHNRVTPTAKAERQIAVALATPPPVDEQADAAFVQARYAQRREATAALDLGTPPRQ